MTSSIGREASAPHLLATAAIQQLAAEDAGLADVLSGLTAAVAEEALQNVAFRARLNTALDSNGSRTESVTPRTAPVVRASGGASAKVKPKRGRRAPGPWDPYDVYTEVGEDGLKSRLNQLELEELRDIIAEHGMNTDGLAMRWTKAERVVGRIVERVVDRAAKGDAFRSA